MSEWIKETPPTIEVGMLVKTNTTTRYSMELKERIYLIGDVNDVSGICDCCREFNLEDIKEYKILVTREDMK